MRNYSQQASAAFLCIILLLSFADGRAESPMPRPDEYELMSLLIDDEYESEFSLILINSETEEWCLGGQIGVLRKKWPELKSETIDALIINNRGERCRLEERFTLPVEYRLVSEQEYAGVLLDGGTARGGGLLHAGDAASATGVAGTAQPQAATEPDWDNFDRVFPDAQGYLTFSRAGFDREMAQALVIFSNAYRCSGSRTSPGKRRIAFFVKKKGEWELAGVSRGIDMMGR